MSKIGREMILSSSMMITSCGEVLHYRFGHWFSCRAWYPSMPARRVKLLFMRGRRGIAMSREHTAYAQLLHRPIGFHVEETKHAA